MAATIDGIVGTSSPTSGSGEEERFLRTRKSFFARVREQQIRHRVEVTDWSPDLIDAALAHARSWVRWLDAAEGDDLLVARGVDTLDVRIGPDARPDLKARIVLPTHPLRALWFANHASLLTHWMDRLDDVEAAKRRRAIELDALANVVPTNVPPLLHHLDSSRPFVFYRNLDPGHGVAFPAGTLNPGHQFALLGTVLGYSGLDPVADGHQPRRAAKTTQRFHDAHPYADPFKLALVNPDDGAFAEQMLGFWEADLESVRGQPEDGDDHDPVELPGLVVTSYARGLQGGRTMAALDRRRAAAETRTTVKRSDHLRPSFSLIESGEHALSDSHSNAVFPNEHHLALIQDISRSAPVGYGTEHLPHSGSGLGLHGLVARFSTLHQRKDDAVQWLHWIDSAHGATPHPVDKRLSDGLVEAHRAAGAASGRLLNQDLRSSGEAFSAIGVYLKAEDLALLRNVHRSADWVLTVDRFFGAELFDTPRDTVLGSDHRTYILDASPDFQDGMGHRSLVTTSSRDEVDAILTRAMGPFGLGQLNESVGALVQTLKMVSGRLVLDALQTDARAREVVALGAVVTWLNATGKLRDTIIVPIDSHLDLFRPGTSDVNLDQKRCDLALFRFVQNRLTITLVEVKSRSSLADLDSLADQMAAQMDATAQLIDHRYFNDEGRVDGFLQRSLLAHVLRFYLNRAERYELVEPPTAGSLRQRIDQLETGKAQVTIRRQGFVIALGQAPTRNTIVVDDQTEIRLLTIADIAKAANGSLTDSPGRAMPTIPVSGVADVDDRRAGTSPKSPDINRANGRSAIDDAGVDGGQEPRREAADDATDPASPTDERTEPSNAADHTELSGPPEQDIILGDANTAPVLWKPRTTGSPHLFILGIPGQGKTVTTERILIELAKFNIPALVLDFHGTLADAGSAYARAARPALLDASKGLPFSPFAIDPRSSWMEVQSHAKEIADVIDHV
ncbi:MAG: hypothetical protein M3457_12510, partial [Chloroflexota bacterium]|nr:hypothetical protein [Chloroflexota bacterium]